MYSGASSYKSPLNLNVDYHQSGKSQVKITTKMFLPRRIDVPFVFYDYTTGKPFENVHRSFVSACKRANIRDFRFHDLRHTFASQLIMAGTDITAIRELLGHKTLTMTLRYAHLAPSHKVKAVYMLDQILTDSQTSQNIHKNEEAANG